MSIESAVGILEAAANSLSLARDDLHEYHQWRSDNVRRLDEALLSTEPFAPLKEGWFFSGDGNGQVLSGRLGSWVADRLLSRCTPQEIIALAKAELAANRCDLFEISPVFGVKLDQQLELAKGVTLLPASDVPLEWFALDVMKPLGGFLPPPQDCCVLRQDFSVLPAFVERLTQATSVTVESETLPSAMKRLADRTKVRAALLLSSSGAVEIPVTSRLGPLDKLLVFTGIRTGMIAPPMLPRSIEVDAAVALRNFKAVEAFQHPEPLLRATDRLGRARTDMSLADAALDLGIAAEIMLMHGVSTGNSEISHKVATRAAWLLGRTPEVRKSVFELSRMLYKARSEAVHLGGLSRRSTFDRKAADEVVRAVLEAILIQGKFPNWEDLILGV